MKHPQFISQSLRRISPKLWQYLKYRQYLLDEKSEREIHLVGQFIDPSRAALDIGVHLGMYTRHFARFTASVIGFEANPDSASFASQSLRGIATIHWVALSSQNGLDNLRIPVDGANGGEAALGTLSPVNQLGGRRYWEVQVPTKRLDDYELPPVGFIKVDVEGHEEAVLNGGENLLMRDRPICMIELEERHNANVIGRVTQHFLNWNYRVVFYNGSRFSDVQEFDVTRHQDPNCSLYINNFFFLPHESPCLLGLR